MKQITVEECRKLSAILAGDHKLHAKHRVDFAPGKRYNKLDAKDTRVFLDAVFVPDGYAVPAKIRKWYATGGSYSHPGEPGQWMFHIGYPAQRDASKPGLFE